MLMTASPDLGLAVRPCVGCDESGDQVAAWQQGGRRILCLIDGLGHGPLAAASAKYAIDLIGHNLRLPLPALLRRCDDALQGRRGLSLAIVLVTEDQLEFVGIGNVRARLVGRRSVCLSCSPGIVGAGLKRIRTESFPLTGGDIVVLYSDGLDERVPMVLEKGTNLATAATTTVRQHGHLDDDVSMLAYRHREIAPDTHSLVERYERVLAGYLDSAEEGYLLQAADMGRELVSAEFPPESIAELHHESVRRLIEGRPRLDVRTALPRMTAPFMEILMAFGLSYRGRIDQYERLFSQLDERQNELTRSNRDLEQFAYAASHDLQEPLRTMTGNLELLHRRFAAHLPEPGAQLLDHSVAAAGRLHALVDGLLSYARAGQSDHPVRPVPMAEVLAIASQQLEHTLVECGGTVTTATRLPTVIGHPILLTQLLQNLVGNGLKFRGDSPPVVTVSCVQEAVLGHFKVCDNGIGIPPEQTQKVFEIFRRLHGGSRYQGSGIGLALCQRIVEQHGGQIWLTSEVGAGTCVHFTLPLAKGEPLGD
jgi:signal transduction histidine kinase